MRVAWPVWAVLGGRIFLGEKVSPRRAAAVALALLECGHAPRGIRLDSGDLAAHARLVRTIFDQGGLQEVSIFASGNLDAANPFFVGRLSELQSKGTPE